MPNRLLARVLSGLAALLLCGACGTYWLGTVGGTDGKPPQPAATKLLFDLDEARPLDTVDASQLERGTLLVDATRPEVKLFHAHIVAPEYLVEAKDHVPPEYIRSGLWIRVETDNGRLADVNLLAVRVTDPDGPRIKVEVQAHD